MKKSIQLCVLFAATSGLFGPSTHAASAPSKPLESDPFHSDDSKDPSMRALSRLAGNRALLRQMSSGSTGEIVRFGYMFPDLANTPGSTLPTELNGDMSPAIIAALEQLADTMKAGTTDVDSAIRGGMTYLGQFVDHDITFDPVSSLGRLNDPNNFQSFRTPGLNLDSLYGGGPDLSPHQYDGAKFRTGGHAFGRDLPRAIKTGMLEGDQPAKAKALIGDPRNDENLIVAQLHTAFIAFHNKMVDRVPQNTTKPVPQVFAEAANLVRWHYQWIVVNEFLPAFVRGDVLADVKANGSKFYKPTGKDVFMPVEFSLAAYRFGHSMVRDDYKFNAIFAQQGLADFFQFRGTVIPDSWEKAQWSWFFHFNTAHSENRAQRIDTRITDLMHAVPTGGAPISVPRNNLKRGYTFSLPTGQAIARTVGVPPLTPDEVAKVNGQELAVFTTNPVLKTRTPLWYYILKEAEVKEGGERLGQVGSRIVVEVILGLLRADRSSYLNSPQGDAWRPTLPPIAHGTAANDFRIVDLIVYADHANPDGTPK